LTEESKKGVELAYFDTPPRVHGQKDLKGRGIMSRSKKHDTSAHGEGIAIVIAAQGKMEWTACVRSRVAQEEKTSPLRERAPESSSQVIKSITGSEVSKPKNSIRREA